MTPEQRSLRASIAAHAMWARCGDRTARTRAAGLGLDERIARDYGIPADLPPAQYAARLASARTAHFRSMAMRSAKVRAARKAAKEGGQP